MARRGNLAVAEAPEEDEMDIQLALFEGHRAERLAIAFSGTIRLKPANADHVALMADLTLGKAVPFSIGDVAFVATVRQRVAKELSATAMLSTSKLDIDLAGGEDQPVEPDQPEDDGFE